MGEPAAVVHVPTGHSAHERSALSAPPCCVRYLPIGHSVQFLACVELWNEPGGQGRQNCVPLSGAKKPTGHGVHADMAANGASKPTGHRPHVVALSPPANLPGGHAVHVTAPIPEKRPAMHRPQSSASSLDHVVVPHKHASAGAPTDERENRPPGHCVHVVLDSAYRPHGHGEHSLSPVVSATRVEMQSSHCVVCSPLARSAKKRGSPLE